MSETRKYKANREGWGRIRKLPSGRFQAGYDGPDGQSYNAPITFSTRGDARAWLSGVRTDIERSKWKSPKSASAETFSTYATTWISQRTSSKGEPLRPKTRAEYLRQLDKGLSEFASDKVTAITPARVRTWHAARLKAGATMAGAEARFLRAIMNTAVEDRIIDVNPVPAKLTKSSSGKTYRVPTVEELTILVEHVDERFKLGVLLAAYGGLRLSEWRALRRRDLELIDDRYVVSVTRQAQHVHTVGWHVGPPKSAHGVRSQTLPQWMTATMDEHLDKHVGAFPDSLLFVPKGSSEFIHDSDFNKSWNPARDAAGVRGQVREHDLRGFASSHFMYTAGANPFEARDFLGHANVRTTEQHYIKKVSDRAGQLADAMPPLPEAKPSTVTKLKLNTGTAFPNQP